MSRHDEYETLRERAGLLDRRSRGRLQLTGADRRSYLHGLLTNDIDALRPGDGCYAALLTPQGRMVSDMRVSETGESILLDLPERVAETVRQRLEDFIFSEDVAVRDVGDSLAHLAVYGPRAPEVLATVLARAAAGESFESRRERLDGMRMQSNTRLQASVPGAPAEGSSVTVVRSDDYGVAGYELFVEARLAQEIANALLAAGAADVSAATVDITRIEAGRPEFGRDMDEHTIPLEAGIEDRAISLTKGCYVGQEIIIRVLHRGHGRVARRLCGFVGGADDGTPQHGDRLAADGKEAGVVTSAAISPRLRRPIGLGYVHRDHAEPGTVLQLLAADGARPVTLVSLPFTHPAAE